MGTDNILDQFESEFGACSHTHGSGEWERAQPRSPNLEQGTHVTRHYRRSPGYLEALEELGIGYSTEPSPNAYACTLTKFVTGDMELVSIALGPDPRRTKRKGDGAPPEEEEKKPRDRREMSPEDLMRSVGRSKRQVRHKCCQIKADHMLTLTVRGEIPDDEFRQALTFFLRKFKRRYRNHHYVLVLERHKKGNLHAHMAVKGFYNYNSIRRLWHWSLTGENRLFMGEDAPGNVNGRTPEKGRDWKPYQLACYLSKYMSKTLDVDPGLMHKKRYWCSEGITPPEKITVYLPTSFMHEATLAQVLFMLTGKTPARFKEFQLGSLRGTYLST